MKLGASFSITLPFLSPIVADYVQHWESDSLKVSKALVEGCAIKPRDTGGADCR